MASWIGREETVKDTLLPRWVKVLFGPPEITDPPCIKILPKEPEAE